MTQEYGLTLFDEVHKLPAQEYKHIPKKLKSRWRLGLTADLAREDKADHMILKQVGPCLIDMSISRLIVEKIISKVNII